MLFTFLYSNNVNLNNFTCNVIGILMKNEWFNYKNLDFMKLVVIQALVLSVPSIFF